MKVVSRLAGDASEVRGLQLGGVRPLDGSGQTRSFVLPCDHLVTHGVVVGGTGSGKTGLLIVCLDLDYRALSNAGVWAIGCLVTDADRERVVEAIAGVDLVHGDAESLAGVLKHLAPRWFVLRDHHRPNGLWLLHSRTTLCWLRGPMTRADLRRLARRTATSPPTSAHDDRLESA